MDPIEFFHEEEPPRFLRAQALAYPDLQRVWTRVQITPFAAHPEVEMVVLDPAGQPAAMMTMVDVPYTYVSLTLHLKQPRSGERYHLLVRLTRDHHLLDQRAVPFDLVFVERDEAKAEADALEWAERAVPITPLPPDEDIPDWDPDAAPAPEFFTNGDATH